MHWFAKRFERGALWAADQDRFASIMLTIASNGTDDYGKVLMVTLDDDAGGEHVYLRLPDPYGHLFPGYEESRAPHAASSLLVGNQSEFERLFRP